MGEAAFNSLVVGEVEPPHAVREMLFVSGARVPRHFCGVGEKGGREEKERKRRK